MNKILLSIVFTILLLSCNSSKESVKSTVSIPDKFTGNLDTNSSFKVFELKEFYKDTILIALIDIALKNNYDLKTVISNIEKSKALFKERRFSLFPSLGINTGAGVQRFGDYTIDGVGNYDANLSPNVFGNRVLPNPVPDYLIGFESKWEVDLWGKLRNLKKSALANFLANQENRKAIQVKREVAADSLQNIKLEVLALQNNSDTVGELGPLQYLSGLTQTPMDKIINILLLIIIFVFDPLAISLVVAANFAFDHANRKNLYDEYEDELEEDLWDDFEEEEDIKDIEVLDAEEIKVDKLQDYNEEDEKRMDIIAQNGNDGEHYEKDWEVVGEEEVKPVKILQKGPTRHRVLYTDGTEKKVDKNDDIIKYL